MNPLLITLSEASLRGAWTMFWQSSLLILLLLGLDRLLQRRIRASVRYGFWLLLLVKLVLPPSLALPTSLAWWILPAPVTGSNPFRVLVHSEPRLSFVADPNPPLVRASLRSTRFPLNPSICAVGIAVSGSLVLLGYLLLRAHRTARQTRMASEPPPALAELTADTAHALGVATPVHLKLLPEKVSPAVCGLFRPTLLVPKALAESLSPVQFRVVLCHELIHLRRGDLWVNLLQTLLQVAYWWHPLLWIANARIRQVREEAVDDAVMVALSEDAEHYAPTLLEVARLALYRPLNSLGLIGILESKTSLRRRVERLLDFQPPRKTGLTVAAVLGICVFAAATLPMGAGPARYARPLLTGAEDDIPSSGRSPLQRDQAGQPVASFAPPGLNPDPANFETSLPASATEPARQAQNPISPLVVRKDPVPEPNPVPTFGPDTGLPTNPRSELARATADLPEHALKSGATTEGQTQPQIHLSAKFVGISDSAAAEFWGRNSSRVLSTTNSAVILSPAEARDALETMKLQPGSDLVDAMTVTTLSGRQVEVQSVEVTSIVTNINPAALTPPGLSGASNALYMQTDVSLGPVLDLLASLDSDGSRIQLDAKVTFREFLGYEQPSNSVTVYINGKKETATPPLPLLHVGRIAELAAVQDANTLVLGGLHSDRELLLKSKVPVLGDIPLLGRLFRSESKSTRRKQVLVFITPTLVDPSGKPLHANPSPSAPGQR